MTTNLPITASIGVGYINPEMQWQNSLDNGKTWTDIAGETMLTFQFNNTASGIYTYRLSVAESGNINTINCRVASKPIIITIHDQPIATATGNSPVCENQLINLLATGGNTYAWSGPASFTSALASPSLIAKSNTGGVYSVTVSNKFGCTNIASYNVTVNPKPIAAIDNVPSFCEGNNVTLQATGGVSYLWLPGKGLSNVTIENPVANPIDTTTYQVIVTSTNNCTDTAAITLNVLKKPVANAGADKIIVKGQAVILDGFAAGGNVSFSWSPNLFMNDPLLIKPTVTPLNDFQYTLDVTSNNGCGTASDDVSVKVYRDIYIPSAFSPNGDGLNDTWVIQGIIAVPNATVTVFNRYGKIVFETTGNLQQWDGNFNGTPSPTGSYTYLINLKNGSPLRKGTLTIVR